MSRLQVTLSPTRQLAHFRASDPITHTVFVVKWTNQMPQDDADAHLISDLLPRCNIKQVWSGRKDDENGHSPCDGTLFCLFVLEAEQVEDREAELHEYATYVADSLKGRLGYPEDLELEIRWSDN